MALTTPRQRSGLSRPSYSNINTNSSPSLSASTAVNRKASLQALTGQRDPKTPAGKMVGGDLEVGDNVNVPGDMYGTVKFIGSVRGKAGNFVGVELATEFAARGKNDGDVDGTQYFQTTIPGAGIFLPVHRAEKRSSPTRSVDSFPATPNTPTQSTANGQKVKPGTTYTPPTPAVPSKFSQSVGPGARPSSPQFKPKRTSLPRPESPFRKPPPLAPTPARTLSQSTRGSRPGLSTTTPSKTNLKASTNTRAPPSRDVPRPYSRSSSRHGNHDEVGLAASTNGRAPSSGTIPSFSQPLRSPSRLGSAGGQDSEILRLRGELAERDKRLAEQAANLSDMEASVKELSALLPPDGLRTPNGLDDQSTGQLRQLLREKNEKITLLTSEFDQHRADFRSTLDSLEMASTETERVYEEQKRDLLAQVQELTDRIAELEELNQNTKDFEDVARQLKGLEDFVQELEEGLEDARRGEAEARGEVEFLRGEVERGRSELKREREKAAAVVTGTRSSKEIDQKEDEIRGLKTIIQTMSTESGHAAGGNTNDVQRLQASLDESQREKERLEREIEQLRRDSAASASNSSNQQKRTSDEQTAGATTPKDSRARSRANTIRPTFAEHARQSGFPNPAPTGSVPPLPSANAAATTATGRTAGEEVYCEMCSSRTHDTLDCTQFQKGYDTSTSSSTNPGDRSGKKTATATATTPSGKENEAGVGVARGGASSEDKWCALCEKDGHLAYECPEEQY